MNHVSDLILTVQCRERIGQVTLCKSLQTLCQCIQRCCDSLRDCMFHSRCNDNCQHDHTNNDKQEDKSHDIQYGRKGISFTDILVHKFTHGIINFIIKRCYLILHQLLCLHTLLFHIHLTGINGLLIQLPVLLNLLIYLIIQFLLLWRNNSLADNFPVFKKSLLLLIVSRDQTVHQIRVVISYDSTGCGSYIREYSHGLTDISLWKTVIGQCMLIAVHGNDHCQCSEHSCNRWYNHNNGKSFFQALLDFQIFEHFPLLTIGW